MKGSPFPQGLELPGGATLARAVFVFDDAVWIHKVRDGRRIVVATEELALVPRGVVEWNTFHYSGRKYYYITVAGALDALGKLDRPRSPDQAMTFARALSRTPGSMGAAIFIEAHEAFILYSDPAIPEKSGALVLGAYLTGGVDIPADDVVALQRVLPKVSADEIGEILAAAGISPMTPIATESPAKRLGKPPRASMRPKQIPRFELAGRPELADFFNEHVIEIVADEERYAAMGIKFPGGIILEGPTGCGKTFAVERLIEHLGWPSFSIEASSVASPYIHETSRKVAEIFSQAMKVAPSVIVIDEMDAFLASRDSASHQHNVEEVAEFLRRIPEASANRVLVIGMTNKLDAIDPAILRRGRFDHVIHVDHAGEAEVAGLLESLLSDIPNDVQDIVGLARELAGRPLSDAAFVVREAGRLAAKGRKDKVSDELIRAALARSPSRNADDHRRIGF